MKLSTVFTLNAIVALLFGICFVLVPAAALAPYGITTDEAGIILARLFGAAVFGYSVLTWTVRNAQHSNTRLAIILALFLSSTVGLIVSLYAQFTGVANMLGWSTVGIYLFFTLSYGYYQFMKPTGA